MHDENITNLGPLATLAGIWEGEKGDDISPDTKRSTGSNKFRERMVFEPIGRIDNHEQVLYALRYSTMAWRLGEEAPFHEEVGYWLWDKANQQVIRSFIVPRGVSVQAGATVAEDSQQFEIVAELGSTTYGICSNKFLDAEFQTEKFVMKVTIHDQESFTYEEDTILKMKGHDKSFHHTDKNTLKRVK